MTHFDLGDGRRLTLDQAARKLELRARLPGAYVFDRATHALRQARALGLGVEGRLDLAFASSWLVNSPATSAGLRDLSLGPNFVRLVTLTQAISDLTDDCPAAQWLEIEGAVDHLAGALGPKAALGAEVLSKVLALVLPETVPLLPEPACRLLLGEPPAAPGARFARCLEVFREATRALETELIPIARAHSLAVLDAAQVLDRLLWFDSEGHRHFPS